MPSKPCTLAGILRSRRHADREYNRARRDPAVARIHGSARWQAVRAQVLRDEPVCRECARLGLTELATQVDHVVPLAVAPERAFDPTNCQPLCSACHARKSASDRRRTGVDPGEGGPPSSQASAAPSARGGPCRFSRVSGSAPNRPESPRNWPLRGSPLPRGDPLPGGRRGRW
jgi:5-methylcytosine-specific restriction protein A